MKHFMKRILLTGLLLSFCGPLVGSSDAFLFGGKEDRLKGLDQKAYPATLCRTVGGTPTYHYRGAIGNNHSTQNVQVYCPLVRDEMAGKLWTINVRFQDKHATKNPACGLYIYDPVNRAGNRNWRIKPSGDKPLSKLFMTVPNFTHSKYASVSVHCQIPPKTSKGVSKIMNIEYSELPKR